jgi:predicted NBD/HSP70 family sugar kinase
MSELPSLDLLRGMTDEQVLSAVMDHGRATRAELASLPGLTKPTVSVAVRRLAESGALVQSGEGSTGRGRAGTYYSLHPDVGHALVATIAPQGIVAEALDAFGDVRARKAAELSRPTSRGEVADALASVGSALADELGAGGGFGVAAVSAADPVDRGSGRLVHLPDAPFLVGDLDPCRVLTPLVSGPVCVDNDVNWAARAEAKSGRADGSTNFVYLHLGEGLGVALVNDGVVQRGGHGLAGEIAHVVVAGPGDVAMPFTDVFAALDLRRPGSTAIDVPKLVAALSAPDRDVANVLTRAVRGILAACVALADPDMVVVSGDWGAEPAFVAPLSEAFAPHPRHLPLLPPTVTSEPALVGARDEALSMLRRDIIEGARSSGSRLSVGRSSVIRATVDEDSEGP